MEANYKRLLFIFGPGQLAHAKKNTKINAKLKPDGAPAIKYLKK
jgi:hypothetical protein